MPLATLESNRISGEECKVCLLRVATKVVRIPSQGEVEPSSGAAQARDSLTEVTPQGDGNEWKMKKTYQPYHKDSNTKTLSLNGKHALFLFFILVS